MLYFISGILFQELILPLLVVAVEVVSTKLETFKVNNALVITKTNSKIRQIAEEEGPLEEKRVIGFVTDSDVAFEEDDEIVEENEDD